MRISFFKQNILLHLDSESNSGSIEPIAKIYVKKHIWYLEWGVCVCV